MLSILIIIRNVSWAYYHAGAVAAEIVALPLFLTVIIFYNAFWSNKYADLVSIRYYFKIFNKSHWS